MDTIRDERDIDLDSSPTLEVEVPAVLRQPRPQAGYTFHARAPQETDIDLITNDEWDTVMLSEEDAAMSYRYMGQTDIDGVRVNVWHTSETEGFIAQKLSA